MQFSRNCFFFYCNTFTIRHLKLASLFCTFFRITNSISALGMRSCCLKVWNFKFGMILKKFQSEGCDSGIVRSRKIRTSKNAPRCSCSRSSSTVRSQKLPNFVCPVKNGAKLWRCVWDPRIRRPESRALPRDNSEPIKLLLCAMILETFCEMTSIKFAIYSSRFGGILAVYWYLTN